MSNIITKIEGSKVWGVFAVVSGVLMIGALAYTVKTILDAKKATNNLKLAQANLEATKVVVDAANVGTANVGEKPIRMSEVPIEVQAPFLENQSDCDGCSSMNGENQFSAKLKPVGYRF